ncbi:MAG: LmbE-like protein [Candidatus Saganbacteria bacterium]|uniref:LmbE-like protein n=1 Tax=Candidatus Saganbacteria bacterium TaxID=2575572 RepID=A0A833L2H4_UNCSA|nr:MAG: LmbE-like protein [Candidatus Saganbacteria bacterium]
MKRVLVVVAHPDDEILGCGGTIAKHIQVGDEVRIIVFGDGVTSRHYFPNRLKKQDKKSVGMRKNEFFKAINLLGVKKENCSYFVLPDQRLDALPLLDIVKRVEKLTEKNAPDIVYTHHWGDLNKDHRVVCEATLTAFRPGRQIVKNATIFCFEIPGNMDILPPKSANTFKAEYVENVSDFIEVKLKALKAYESELQDYPHPFSPQAVEELAQKRGKAQKYKYAEAFERLKRVN